MEEKYYNLLEKVYREVLGVKEDLKKLDSRLTNVEATMATKENLELAIEEVKSEVQVVYDEVKLLRQDFTLVEAHTYKNAFEISKMKIAK